MSNCCNEFEFTNPQGTFYMDGGIRGKDGVTFYPHVSAAGVLSWTNDGGKQNPDPVNIKGADGMSAYAAAQQAGFTGTEQEFNTYLAGIGELSEDVADLKSANDYVIKTKFPYTFEAVPFLSSGGFVKGRINTTTGSNASSTTRARRSNSVLSGNYVSLGTDDYEYTLFYYDGLGSSWTDTYTHVYSDWIKGSVWTLIDDSIGDRARIVIRHPDDSTISDADLDILTRVCVARNLNQITLQITTKKGNPVYIGELEALARDWYSHRNDIVGGSKAMVYGNNSILNTSSYTREIDCSTFVGMLLRGYSFSQTPYATGQGASPDSWTGNTAYNWTFNPFDYSNYSRIDSSSRSKVRYASQMAEMMIERGQSVPIDRYYANIEPGDVLFFARHDSTTNDWYEPLRFKHINHVAICIAKEKATSADGWDTATYPWKHTFAEVGHEDETTPDGVIKIRTLEQPQGDTSAIFENNINTLCLVCRPDLGSIDDYTELSDEVDDLTRALNNTLDIAWITGKYINNNGVEVSNNSFKSTDYILLSDVLYGIEYKLCLASNANIVSFYNAEKTYINGIAGAGNNIQKTGVLVYPISENIDNNAKYVRFSHCIASAGVTNPEPVILSKNIISNTMLSANSIKTVNIENESVTKSKTDFIIHDPTSNYIDKEQYSNGYINASGRFVSNNGWRATGYCKLLPNTHYYGSGLHGGYCAFYKSDLTVIQGYGAFSFDISSFTTPAETAFARFSLNASSQSVDAAWIFTQNEKPKDYAYILDGVGVYTDDGSNPCDYIGNEISVFNKILCVGDSMTEGTFNHLDSGSTQYINISKYAYPQYLHTITGVEVTNLGHGGQTSVQWYNTEKDNDLGGYDCAIVQLGINDFGTYGELGNDTKTAFQNIISKLKTQNKNIKIFVANIIPAASYSSDGYKQFSSDLLDWLETTYASDKDVIPLDIQQYGHTGDSSAYNCGHLSALGYHRLAEDYKGYISWYINQNKNVFREVQFIGTDYWYVNPNT